jgi:hypothetical protein
MVFFFMYLFSGFLSLILLPIVVYFVCKKMGADVSEINAKIIKISEMPTQGFSPDKFQAQKFCAICMENFAVADSVSWLSCDTRHYFHSDCIKFWLHR